MWEGSLASGPSVEPLRKAPPPRSGSRMVDADLGGRVCKNRPVAHCSFVRRHCGSSRKEESVFTPESPGSLRFRFSSLRWEGLDVRDEARAAQPSSLILQLHSLDREPRKPFTLTPTQVYPYAQSGRVCGLCKDSHPSDSSLHCGFCSPAQSSFTPESCSRLL